MDDLRLSAATTAVVAALALAIAIGAWRALLRTGNRSVGYVVVGFAVFFAKSTWKAATLARGVPEGAALELTFSLMDIAAMAAIAWPLFVRRPQPDAVDLDVPAGNEDA